MIEHSSYIEHQRSLTDGEYMPKGIGRILMSFAFTALFVAVIMRVGAIRKVVVGS